MTAQTLTAHPAAPLWPVGALPDFRGKRAPVAERPEQLWVKVADLRVDRAYQRRISARGAALIRRMVEAWDWTLVQAITVAEIGDGLWELIDGQHRAVAAATHGAIPLLPATVVKHVDRAASARAFVALNSARVAVTAGQRMKAAIAAGDAAAREVSAGAAQAGAKLVFNPPGRPFAPGETMAVAALERLAKAGGAERVAAALRPLVAAGLAPIRAEHVAAVDAALTAPEFSVDPAALPAALARWEHLLDAADLRRADTGQTRARCLAIELAAACEGAA